MSRVRFRAAISLDGYVAGPNQSLENPMGQGGLRLHEWAFALEFFRKMQGREGGEVNASTAVIQEAFANVGATIMGRNMFGPVRGRWEDSPEWNGWWGDDPPFHHPVFVLTHHPRARLELQGGNSFTFVTDGIESALAQARRAAGSKDISIGGGASTVRQFLRAGLVDEMQLHLAPIVLGAGERLLDGVDDLHGMRLVRTIEAPGVVHLKFAR